MRDPFTFSGDYGESLDMKLAEIITQAPTRRTILVIRKVLENLVLAERLAASRNVEITDRDKRQLMQQDHDGIKAEVDRALGEFIGAILSAEGG